MTHFIACCFGGPCDGQMRVERSQIAIYIKFKPLKFRAYETVNEYTPPLDTHTGYYLYEQFKTDEGDRYPCWIISDVQEQREHQLALIEQSYHFIKLICFILDGKGFEIK
jgi:hypothetical protein